MRRIECEGGRANSGARRAEGGGLGLVRTNRTHEKQHDEDNTHAIFGVAPEVRDATHCIDLGDEEVKERWDEMGQL